MDFLPPLRAPSRHADSRQIASRGKLRGLNLAFALSLTAPASAQTVLEPDFEVSVFATGLTEPVAIACAPDGRMFVAERHGTIRIVQDGALQPEPFAELVVFSEAENGLLGLALDPDFQNSPYVYAFATRTPDEQEILRFREEQGSAVEEVVIRDRLPTRGVFHSGGGLKFGPDGKLYFSIGDTQEPELAQDMNSLAGKICRINPDGGVPADNPFQTPTGSPRSIYALGFRNPFRFTFASDGRMFVLDVGSDGAGRREEINLVRAGDNCGWPIAEGGPEFLPLPDLTYPIYTYHEKGAAPTGVVYYDGGQFPAEFDGNLFHVDFVLNRVYRVKLDGDRVVEHTTFVEGSGGVLDLAIGPDGALYYCELYTGRVIRIASLRGPETVAGETTDGDSRAPPSLCGFGAQLLAFPAFALGLTGRARRGWLRWPGRALD